MFTGSLVTKQSILAEFIFGFYVSHTIHTTSCSFHTLTLSCTLYTHIHMNGNFNGWKYRKKRAKTTRTKEGARKKYGSSWKRIVGLKEE